MMAAADAAGADWRLHYGARSLERMAFTGELARHGDRCVLYPEDSRGLMPLTEMAVLEGEVDHRDSVLTEEERTSGRTMMLCVSRGRARQWRGPGRDRRRSGAVR
jgi:ferredoxin-NADP reductase